MKRAILGGFAAVLMVWAAFGIGESRAQSGGAGPGADAASGAQDVAPPLFGQPGAPPQMAFDIPKSDVDTLLKNVPAANALDQVLRVVDMGGYNLGVAAIHRGPTNDKPGVPIAGPYHDYTAETYIILSGGGVLTTGGMIENKKVTPTYNFVNGPSGTGTAGAVSRKLGPGDIVLIPPGVLHVWSQVTDHVDYLSVRPDPYRTLPAGYINPLLLKNVEPASTKQ